MCRLEIVQQINMIQVNPLVLDQRGETSQLVVHESIRRIAVGEVPAPLRSHRVITLDYEALLRGTTTFLAFADQLMAVLTVLSQLEEQIILYVKNVHILVGAEPGRDATGVLMGFLSRSKVQVLGTCPL